MAFRSNSASFAVLLALLLSLHCAASFSLAASSPITRIKQEYVGHVHRRRRYRRVVVRQTAARAISAPALDEWKPQNDNFSRLKSSPLVKFLHSCYTRYLHLCENRPFPTNSITAGVLAGMGDILAQSLEVGSAAAGISSFNWVRWRTFMLTGLFFKGPWMSLWYNGLTRLGIWMESKYQSGPREQVLGQVVADQTLGVVLFYPTFFVVYECIGAILVGQVPNLHTVLTACRVNLAAVLWTQYKVWPVVDIVNFSLVPEPLRVLFCNLVTLFWNIYIAGTLAGATS